MAYEAVPFHVVEVEWGRRFTLYTVQFQGHERTELRKWAENDEICSHEEFKSVWSSFRAIPDEGLPKDCFFKQENYEDYGWVTPFVSDEYHAELRLYCIHREGSDWVLAGNGCVKEGGGPLQEFPACNLAFQNILSVDRRIRQSLQDGTNVGRGDRGEHLIDNPFYPPE